MFIKFVTFFTNNFNLSAVLISWIFSILSSVLLFELALIDFNKRIGILSVWFLNIFPTSFFLQAGYTESLFLTLSLASIYLYRKKVFLLSGITGLFSSMTRINGMALIPFYFFETIQNKISFSKTTIFFLVSFLTASGFMVYLLINFSIFGDLFYFTKPLSEHWYKRFTLPWNGIRYLMDFTQSQRGSYYYLFTGETVAIIFAFFFTSF